MSKVQPPELAEVTNDNSEKGETSEVNGTKTEHHHHHHKKSRSSKKDEKEASSDDKKSRDKKKRKKSKEHEKKKSKKDRKEKKESPELQTPVVIASSEKEQVKKEEVSDQQQDPAPVFNRSDSVLDINLEEEWIGAAPEVSKWEREENNKSLENSEVDVDAKKGGEEKITSEVLKRAEHVLFTKAISAIRPKSPIIVAINESLVVAKGSIKNRLGKKVTEKSSRSRTPPIMDQRPRRQDETPEQRRGKQLSSCIRVSNDGRKVNDRKRTRTPEERKPRRSRTPETSRSRNQRPTITTDKNSDSRSKIVAKKHSRSSSSSSASTNSGETSKRHKHKVKKRSRSPSVDSSGKTSKKRKKDKKKKKDKKSKKDKEKSSDTKRDRD